MQTLGDTLDDPAEAVEPAAEDAPKGVLEQPPAIQSERIVDKAKPKTAKPSTRSQVCIYTGPVQLSHCY